MTMREDVIASVIAAYFSKNEVPQSEIASVINRIRNAMLTDTAVGQVPQEAPTADDNDYAPGDETPTNVTPARRLTAKEIAASITPEYLRSFEDGRQYRALKGPLARKGLTPEAYRAKWGLPADYPMTAQAFSEQRSALAKRLGLGVTTRAGMPKNRKVGGQPGNKNAARGRGRG